MAKVELGEFAYRNQWRNSGAAYSPMPMYGESDKGIFAYHFQWRKGAEHSGEVSCPIRLSKSMANPGTTYFAYPNVWRILVWSPGVDWKHFRL